MCHRCYSVLGHRLGRDRGRKFCDKLRETWNGFEPSAKHDGSANRWASVNSLQLSMNPSFQTESEDSNVLWEVLESISLVLCLSQ